MKYAWLPTTLFIGSIAAAVVGTPCEPSCAPDRGVCLEGRCLCRSPFGGAGCEEVVLGGEPAEDDAPTARAPDSFVDQALADAMTEHASAAPLPSQLPSEQAEVIPPPEPVAEFSESESEADADQEAQTRGWEQETPAAPLTRPRPAETLERISAAASPPRAAGSLRRSRHLRHSLVTLQRADHAASANAELRKKHSSKKKQVGTSNVTDPRTCIPWLAEMRSTSLKNVSIAQKRDVIKDMQVARLDSFRLWAGGESKLEKSAFRDKLGMWFKGPGEKDALELFDRLDQSPKDGALTFDEYNWENLCGYRQLLLTVLSSRDEKFSQAFHFMDTSQDGKVEEKEFMARSTGKELGLSEAVALAIFKVLDADDSGVLSRAEFQQLGGLPRLRREVSQREPYETVAFEEADTDKDGFLSHEEFDQHVVDMGAFTKAASSIPALLALDRNKDDKVAEDEYVITCSRNTGGSCELGGVCESWRGPSFCESVSVSAIASNCMCAEGFCAKHGACIPEELHSAGDSPLGPGSHNYAKKMKSAEDGLYMRKVDSVEFAKVAMLLLSFTAVLGQVKGTFENYPGVMAFVFQFCVVAFVLTVYGAFRSWVPGTITSNIQALFVVLLCASCTLTLTSAVRLVRPSSAKSVPILWYSYDDGADYGISVNEERYIRIYQRITFCCGMSCIAGVYFAPVPGLEDDTFKMLLCGLYTFVMAMDSFMLQHEAELASFRNLIWNVDIQVASGDQKAKVKIDAVAAHWNHREEDASKEFMVRRRSPSAKPVEAVPRVSDKSPFSQASTLYFLNPEGDDVHYVRGHVVLLWEDTDVQLVQRGTSQKWISACSPEAAETGAAMTSDLETMCPCVRTRFADVEANITKQSIQETMHVLTQAGAAGLIVGHRSFSVPSSEDFQKEKSPVKDVWPGTYLIHGTDRQFGPEDYKQGWYLKLAVPLGCAINTFIIANQDFQELVWNVKACNDTTQREGGRKQSMVAVGAHMPESHLTCIQSFKVATEENLNKLNIIKPENQVFDDLCHLKTGQRLILESIKMGNPSGQFQWLENIRSFVTSNPIIKAKAYPGIHLFMTFTVLMACLLVLEQLSCQLYDNGFPLFATVSFAFIALVQGLNASYDQNWWPKSQKSRRGKKQLGHGLGVFATGSVIVIYSATAVGFCLWHFVRDISGS